MSSISKPTRAAQIPHNLLLNAISSIWYPLYTSNACNHRFSICTLESAWYLESGKKIQYYIGNSDRLLIPFSVGALDVLEEDQTGNVHLRRSKIERRSSDSHNLLAIATKSEDEGRIQIHVYDSDTKHKSRNQVRRAIRNIVRHCGWVSRARRKNHYTDSKGHIRFAVEKWVPVTQRPKNQDTCALDTILYAWSHLLGLKLLPAAAGVVFEDEVYNTAFRLVELALDGRLHAETVANFLFDAEFIKEPAENLGWKDVKSVAVNETVMENIAVGLHGVIQLGDSSEETTKKILHGNETRAKMNDDLVREGSEEKEEDLQGLVEMEFVLEPQRLILTREQTNRTGKVKCARKRGIDGSFKKKPKRSKRGK